MPLTPEKLYRVHVSNLNEVTSGIEQIERALRAAISRQDGASSKALLKILLLLTGSWAECRLRKLLYEPNGFNDADREYITDGRTQLDHWMRAIEVGFRRRHNIPRANLLELLRLTPRLLYSELTAAIESDLRPIIEMRNTLAHGQWARPLNSACTDVSTDMLVELANENALSARFKARILESLAHIIHDLVSGNHAFERDIDQHYGRIENARLNLKNRDYQKWESQMVEKYKKGQERRNVAIKSTAAEMTILAGK